MSNTFDEKEKATSALKIKTRYCWLFMYSRNEGGFPHWRIFYEWVTF